MRVCGIAPRAETALGPAYGNFQLDRTQGKDSATDVGPWSNCTRCC